MRGKNIRNIENRKCSRKCIKRNSLVFINRKQFKNWLIVYDTAKLEWCRREIECKFAGPVRRNPTEREGNILVKKWKCVFNSFFIRVIDPFLLKGSLQGTLQDSSYTLDEFAICVRSIEKGQKESMNGNARRARIRRHEEQGRIVKQTWRVYERLKEDVVSEHERWKIRRWREKSRASCATPQFLYFLH